MRPRLGLIAAATMALLALPGAAAGAPLLYQPSYGSGPPEVVERFERAPDGSLTPRGASAVVAGPPYAVGGFIAMAFTPEGDRAVASFLFDGGIQGLAVAPNGQVGPAGAPITASSVTGLAVSPDGRFAYAPTRDFGGDLGVGILGYSINADGSLAPLAGSPFGSSEVGDIAITPDGSFLYALAPNQVQRFSVAADGKLAPLGTTAVGGVRTLAVSPDGRFLFVGVAAGGDGVVSLSISPQGDLTRNGPPALTGDVSLDYFAVAPDGGHVYMPDSNLDGIVTAAVAGAGTLSVIDTLPVENPESAAVSPDGRFLYYLFGSLGEIGVAALGSDGVPSLLPFTVPADSGEPERILFRPRSAPTARFSAKPGEPRAKTRFDATRSAGAVRYAWDFGDGTTLDDGGPSPTHTYAKAGKYRVTLTVADEQGCSAAQIYTGQSTSCPGGDSATVTKKVDTPPRLSGLKVADRRFEEGTGTTFRYRLSERAKLRIKIERANGGGAGTIKDAAKKGRNRTEFSGELRGKPLEPGRYRAIARARDKAGSRSEPEHVSFRVTP